jgi:hypothetical protein
MTSREQPIRLQGTWRPSVPAFDDGYDIDPDLLGKATHSLRGLTSVVIYGVYTNPDGKREKEKVSTCAQLEAAAPPVGREKRWKIRDPLEELARSARWRSVSSSWRTKETTSVARTPG